MARRLTFHFLRTEAASASVLAAAAVGAVLVANSPWATDCFGALKTEHAIHVGNAYVVLPLFAFAKAGVSLAGLTFEQALAPLVVAIALGLFLGKQAGVLGAVWVVTKLALGERPSDATWRQIYGVSLLCGMGFTMSLFVGALAFPGYATELETEVKLGVLGGSLLSAAVGATVLALAKRASPGPTQEAAR